jgi:hypothetical protein
LSSPSTWRGWLVAHSTPALLLLTNQLAAVVPLRRQAG